MPRQSNPLDLTAQIIFDDDYKLTPSLSHYFRSPRSKYFPLHPVLRNPVYISGLREITVKEKLACYEML